MLALLARLFTRMRNRAMIMTKPPYWRVAETVGANSAGTKKAPGSLPQGLSLRRYTAWEEPEINPRRAIILARRWHGRGRERAAEAAPIVAAHAGRAAAGKATPLVILRACAQLAVARQFTEGRK
jgi:hypothetical protein